MKIYSVVNVLFTIISSFSLCDGSEEKETEKQYQQKIKSPKKN